MWGFGFLLCSEVRRAHFAIWSFFFSLPLLYVVIVKSLLNEAVEFSHYDQSNDRDIVYSKFVALACNWVVSRYPITKNWKFWNKNWKRFFFLLFLLFFTFLLPNNWKPNDLWMFEIDEHSNILAYSIETQKKWKEGKKKTQNHALRWDQK